MGPAAQIDLVNRFCALFDGSREAVGTEEGGCRRLTDPEDWLLELEGHLRFPDCQVGVYPMTTMIDDDWTTVGTSHGPYNWVVKWGCVDFDMGEEESWAQALDLSHCLEQFKIKSWIERSRSKGYHVWIFLEAWTDAEVVRRALLAASQIVGTSTKEINPKQVELEPGQLGNYVRLPYPGWLDPNYRDEPEPKRAMIGVDGVPHSLSWFVDVAEQTLVTPRELEELAWYYVAPPSPAQLTRDWTRLEGSSVDRLRGKTRIIWEQGPLETEGSPTNFRGQTLWKLARYIVEDGRHTPEEALELLTDADVRWGKFYERADGPLRLRQMVDKAFAS